jgi:hypothetical protein
MNIVVKRVSGANTNEPFLIKPLKIGVIAQSRGKNTADSIDMTRASWTTVGANTDALPTSSGIVHVRSVERAVNNATNHTDETFYAGIHFTVKDAASSGTILNARNLGDVEDAEDIYISWDEAPALIPPSCISATVASTGAGLTGTTYYYKVSVVDQMDNESNPGPEYQVSVGAGVSNKMYVTLRWKRVQYSTGYYVYRKESGGTWRNLGLVSGKDTTVLIDHALDTVAAGSAAKTTNATKAVPASGATAYTLYYTYGDITTDTAKEFTTVDQVEGEHGTGSEMANIARLYMDESYNNAPVLVTVVPSGTDISAYQTAAQVFESYHVNFIVGLFAGTTDIDTYKTNVKPLYDMCASLSDPETGQKECFGIFGLPGNENRTDNTDVTSFLEGFQATATSGKRGVLVVPDGHKIVIAQWQNPDETWETNYTLEDSESVDITPLVFAGAAFARYAGIQDLAEPLTEKDVAGFVFTGTPFSNGEVDDLTTDGAMVVRNDSGTAVVNRFINMSLPVLSLQDAEMSIAVPEDWMKDDLRRTLKKFRGQKMLGVTLSAAERSLRQKLEQYVNEGIMAWFDSSKVSTSQDTTQLDRLLGYFEYMPIYPVNSEQILYNFTVVVL